jgi:hypothetical protein
VRRFTPVDRKTKDSLHHRWYMVYTAYTFKMFSIMKKTISFGVRDIGWILVFYILDIIERSNNSDFEGVTFYIHILVVLAN